MIILRTFCRIGSWQYEIEIFLREALTFSPASPKNITHFFSYVNIKLGLIQFNCNTKDKYLFFGKFKF